MIKTVVKKVAFMTRAAIIGILLTGAMAWAQGEPNVNVPSVEKEEILTPASGPAPRPPPQLRSVPGSCPGDAAGRRHPVLHPGAGRSLYGARQP